MHCFADTFKKATAFAAYLGAGGVVGSSSGVKSGVKKVLKNHSTQQN